MKILMCNSYYYLRGGSERCFFDLTALLEAHGHDVIPFSMIDERNQPTEYKEFFISHVDFPSRLAQDSSFRSKIETVERVLYSREARGKIEQLLADTKPDIAHIHGIAQETSPSILPAIKKAGIPIVQTLHDYKLLCPNTNFVSQGQICERCKVHRYYNVLLHRCKRDSLAASFLAGLEMVVHKMLQIYERNVDVFITPSEFLRDKLVAYGIRNKIVHLPNFIDLQGVQAGDESEDYFVYYGRVTAVKGVRTLLQAMLNVPRSHLFIAGTGDLEAELQAFVRENSLENVSFLGHLHPDELFPLVRKAAFSIVPSEWYENYSMSVIESLARGTPVIGARIGGIPEQVIDGWNGLLFESGNVGQLSEKINFMLSHPAARREMGRNGRAQIEKINGPARHYQKTLAIYRELLGSDIRHRHMDNWKPE
jgi:glycosyltransferase involved in cell wall biosynthesis